MSFSSWMKEEEDMSDLVIFRWPSVRSQILKSSLTETSLYDLIRLFQSVWNFSTRVRTTDWLCILVIQKQEQMESVVERLWTQPLGCSQQHPLAAVPQLLMLDIGHCLIATWQIRLTSKIGKHSYFSWSNKSWNLCKVYAFIHAAQGHGISDLCNLLLQS